MEPYVPPASDKDAFNCPYCGVYAQQTKYLLCRCYQGGGSDNILTWEDFGCEDPLVEDYDQFAIVRQCYHCKKYSLWIAEERIFPRLEKASLAPAPLPEMPEKVKKLYLEASSIADKSPAAAAILLRTALEKLCEHLGAKSENLYEAIEEIYNKKDIPEEIMEAMDAVRITGNDAAHPRTINFDDNEEIVSTLFSLLNYIVDQLIVQPQKRKDFFESLPKKPGGNIKRHKK